MASSCFRSLAFLCAVIAALDGGAATAQDGLVIRGQELALELPPASLRPPPEAASLGVVAPRSISAPTPRMIAVSLNAANAARASSDPSGPIPRPLSPVTVEITLRCAEIRRIWPEVVCEPNYVYFSSQIPSDSLVNDQYAVGTASLEAAWNITTGSPTVTVAVIDTGVDYTHPDLAANIAPNEGELPGNGRDDDGNGYTDDYLGHNTVARSGDPYDDNEHGTHVAGIIGAVGNNGEGVAGVAWNVGLIPVKVLDSTGAGTIVEIVQGIDYAIARGARIINMSLGGAGYSIGFHRAIARAKEAGILVVAAAGNESTNNDIKPSYPAAFYDSNIVSVTATDADDTLAYFSNVGAKGVDLGAPGVDIISTIPGNDYDHFSGTSMAAPHVAGVAALLLSINDRFSYRDLRRLILETTRSLDELAFVTATGGVLDALAAVERAQEHIPTTVNLKLNVSLKSDRQYIVARVTDIDGPRPGVRVGVRCGSQRLENFTNRSGLARFLRLKFKTLPARCQAVLKTSAGRTKSKARTMR